MIELLLADCLLSQEAAPEKLVEIEAGRKRHWKWRWNLIR